MVIILYILLSFTYINSIGIITNEKLEEFIQFTKKYNKVYSSKEEFNTRFEIWKQNYKKVESANNKSPKISPIYGISSFDKFSISTSSSHFTLNKFADLTQKEFSSKYLTFSTQFIKDLPTKTGADLGIDDIQPPENFDWELNRGLRTKIKDQKDCGSCYAFATVGVMQSQYLLKYGENISFSEQQIVDCDEANSQCLGGNTKKAFNYLKKFGIMKEDDYPYINGEGKCKYDGSKTLAKVKTFSYIPKDEEEMKKVLYKYGPIAGAINGIMTVFYDHGIYDPYLDGYCPSNINHAVLIVGYGVDKATGKKFWRVKNSMGQDWGENGYFRLLRGTGACGINQYNLIAEIEKLK